VRSSGGHDRLTAERARQASAGPLRIRGVADTALILGLAGIGGTLTVGIASPFIAARFAAKQQSQALEHERTMRDEEELRAVLDEVAGRLDDCETTMRALEGRYLVFGRNIAEEEQGRAAILGSGDANLRLGRSVDRLAVRLGRHHPMTRAAADARNALMGFTSAVSSLGFMPDQAQSGQHHAEMEAAKRDLDQARVDFMELATAYAGSRVPRRPEAEIALIRARHVPPPGNGS
jgi:hypothetical protein